jgi:mycofactocin precursor
MDYYAGKCDKDANSILGLKPRTAQPSVFSAAKGPHTLVYSAGRIMSINQLPPSPSAEAAGAQIQSGEAPAATPRRKLDLSRLEAPAALEECSVEEMTIDGICGVY